MTEKNKIIYDGRTMETELDDGKFIIDGKSYSYAIIESDTPMIQIKLDDSLHVVYCTVDADKNEAEVWCHNHILKISIEDRRSELLRRFRDSSERQSGTTKINAPMPGLVKKIEISENQDVKKGEGLIILEAMKMENEIKSPVDGVVRHIKIKEQSSVEKGQELLIIESGEITNEAT